MEITSKRYYEFGAFQIDSVKRLLMSNGAPVQLTPKAFEILLTLVQNSGRVVKKDELLQKVWPGVTVEENNLSVNISALRKALGDNSKEHRYIVTVPGQGYSFVANVKETQSATTTTTETATIEPDALHITFPKSGVEVIENDKLSVAEALAQLTPAIQENRFIQEQTRDAPPTATNFEAEETAATRLRISKINLFRGKNLYLAVALGSALCLLAVWLMAVVRSSINRNRPQLKLMPVTSFSGTELSPALSPDGNQIAFSWDGANADNQDIYIKLVGDATPLRLTTDAAVDTAPAWSSDGRYIAFVRRVDDSRDAVYVVPALGGTERKIADIAASKSLANLRLSWSADGESIAASDRVSAQEPISIFLVSIKTGEKRRVTAPPLVNIADLSPSISPDGRTLAFIRRTGFSVEDIYITNLSSTGPDGELKRLTFDNALLASLAWTADGQGIIFSSTREGLSSLWRIQSSGGGEPERLGAVALDALQPTVARYKERLAYVQSLSDANIWQIEVSKDKNKSSPPRKLIASTRHDAGPRYAPDGNKIAFVSNRSGSLELWVCDSDGSKPTQVTNMGGPFISAPRWSPDSRRILFDSRVKGNADVFVVDLEDARPRRLTTEASEDLVPSWSRDGRWVYFGSNRGGDFQTWKIPSQGGPAQQVTKHGGFETIKSADGKYLYYVKEIERPGIWRVPVDGGDETIVIDSLKAGASRYWDVTVRGIYFVSNETAPHPTVQFFDFETNQITEVARLETTLIMPGHRGLSVSPDGRWIIYAQLDQTGADIMLVDNAN